MDLLVDGKFNRKMDQNRQNQRKDQKIEPRGSDKSKVPAIAIDMDRTRKMNCDYGIQKKLSKPNCLLHCQEQKSKVKFSYVTNR